MQADDRVVNTDWDLEDKYMWKGMNPAQINALTPSPAIGSIMPSTGLDVAAEEKLLESILRDKIAGVRRNDHNMGTEFDSQLSYMLSTALSNYEVERIGGQSFASKEF